MFQDKLKKYNIDPKIYLDIARRKAFANDYDPSLLHFSKESTKKLCYAGIEFGASNYKDYIIYSLLEPEKAENRRKAYWSRALKTAIESDKYSPSQLSLKILW